MLGPSHAALGAAAAAVTTHVLGADVALAHALGAPVALAPVAGLLLVPLGGLAALLPDPGSTLGKLLPRWWHELTPGHRRCTHSLLAVLLAGVGVHWLAGALGVTGLGLLTLTAVVVVGMLSHLAADGITDHGVPLLWPWKRRFGVPLFATGTWPEHAVVWLAVAGVAGWLLGLGDWVRGGVA